MKLNKILCYFFGHIHYQVGEHESFCLRCKTPQTDLDLTDIPKEDIEKYMLSIRDEYGEELQKEYMRLLSVLLSGSF